MSFIKSPVPTGPGTKDFIQNSFSNKPSVLGTLRVRPLCSEDKNRSVVKLVIRGISKILVVGSNPTSPVLKIRSDKTPGAG